METQKFIFPFDANGKFSSNGEVSTEALIPKYCETCSKELVLTKHPLWPKYNAFKAELTCEHYNNVTYNELWKRRILSDKIEYGVNCCKCKEFYPYTEKKPDFKCWGCKNF